MTDFNILHNAGVISTLNIFSDRLTETACSQKLPVTAVLQESTLTLKTGSTTLTLSLYHNIEQLEPETGLIAIDESLCKELDTMAAAYPQVKWLPVGRFTARQLTDYMKSPYVCAVCDLSFIDAAPAEWDTKCFQLRNIALGYAFAHVGIHNENSSNCQTVVNTLQSAFNFPVFDIGSSVMITGSIEATKSKLQDTCGHIGIETASVARAMNDLQSKGFFLDESTIQYQPTGRPQSVYLNIRLGGFAVHLLQKR